MKFIIENKPRISFSMDGQIEVTFLTKKQNLSQFQALKDETMSVEIKKFRKSRTLSQNSYLWVLLDKIGEAVGKSKEQVYQTYVKDYGVFEILPIKNEAVERFKKSWVSNGLGWLCQELGESKLDGYTKLIAYYGSSTYDSKEMARIINAVIQDAQELGIDTLPLKDFMLLKNENDEV